MTGHIVLLPSATLHRTLRLVRDVDLLLAATIAGVRMNRPPIAIDPPPSLAACERCQEAYEEARTNIEEAGGLPAWMEKVTMTGTAPPGPGGVKGSRGPDSEERGVLMTCRSMITGIALGRAALIGGIVLTAGCSAPLLSAPVLRTPSFVDAPAYDSPRCEDARRLDAQAATWWLPSSCFKAVSTPPSGT